MKDCVFLLADGNMRAAFEGFLTRPDFNRRLSCGGFEFDQNTDLIVASGDNDPGLFVRGHELLRPFQHTHKHAMIVLDAQWDGSPGREAIVAHMTEQILQTGWMKDAVKVIVIDPELENWIWQRNDHVAQGLGFADKSFLMAEPVVREVWPDDQGKPSSPKETLEEVLWKQRIPRSSSIYKNITSRVSVRACRDFAFLELKDVLQTWFPLTDNTGKVNS
jgi:hypothetical protein